MLHFKLIFSCFCLCGTSYTFSLSLTFYAFTVYFDLFLIYVMYLLVKEYGQVLDDLILITSQSTGKVFIINEF